MMRMMYDDDDDDDLMMMMIYCRAHSLANGSSCMKKGISVDSLLEKIPVNTDTRVSTILR